MKYLPSPSSRSICWTRRIRPDETDQIIDNAFGRELRAARIAGLGFVCSQVPIQRLRPGGQVFPGVYPSRASRAEFSDTAQRDLAKRLHQIQESARGPETSGADQGEADWSGYRSGVYGDGG